ncbi:glycosyltransferase family 2 protein [Caldisericum sp.]|uniref:glycosyltransferase family 2 protein n=1 Tax=Caldisericum sp. TaxID=2499687 RepID=UPI003D1430C2
MDLNLRTSELDFSIILVTYNSEDFIRECLESIYNTIKNTKFSFEVIVVDNNSQDATVKMLRDFPEVKLIKNKENLGFSRANNLAFENSKGKILFFLNPDTKIISSEIFEEVYKIFSTNSGIGAIGVKLVDEKGKAALSGFSFEPWWSAILSLLSMQFIDFRIIKDEHLLKKINNLNHPVEVDWVSGGAMFISREVYSKVSGFDSNFFLYSEDVDICKRIKDRGLKILFLPYIYVLHYTSHSSKNFERRIDYRYRSLLLYAAKHYKKWRYFLYKISLILNAIEKLLFTIIFGKFIFNTYEFSVRKVNYKKALKFLINEKSRENKKEVL